MAKTNRYTTEGTEIKLSENELLAVQGIAQAEGQEWKLVTACYGKLLGHEFAGSLSFLKTKGVVEAIKTKVAPGSDTEKKVEELGNEGGMVEDLAKFLPEGVLGRVAKIDALTYNLELAKKTTTLVEVWKKILDQKARETTYIRLTSLGQSFVTTAKRVPTATEIKAMQEPAQETSPEGEKKGKKAKKTTDSLKAKGPIRGGAVSGNEDLID
jgi:hypothetical protein